MRQIATLDAIGPDIFGEAILSDLNRFPALDGLRGTAALWVMFHHLGFPIFGGGPSPRLPPLGWIWSLGWSGVDLFFVLSGFLITGILVKNKDAPNYFQAFYWHRALRIFPPLYLLLCIFTIWHPTWAVLPYWLFAANLRIADIAYIPYITVTWTLAIEEQFYIGWSIVVRFLTVRHLAQLATALLIGSILLRCFLLWYLSPSDRKLDNIFTFTLSHLDGLCIGILIRLAFDAGRTAQLLRFSKTWWIWLAIYVVGIVIDVHFEPGVDNWRLIFNMMFGITLLSLFFGAIMMSGLIVFGTVRRIFSNPFLQRMGAYSYFMYLFHFPSQLVVDRLSLGLPMVMNLILEFGLTIAAAHISFFYFERPLLAQKWRVDYGDQGVLRHAPRA